MGLKNRPLNWPKVGHPYALVLIRDTTAQKLMGQGPGSKGIQQSVPSNNSSLFMSHILWKT